MLGAQKLLLHPYLAWDESKARSLVPQACITPGPRGRRMIQVHLSVLSYVAVPRRT